MTSIARSRACAALLALALAGCASNAENMAPAGPNQPWTAPDDGPGFWSQARPRAEGTAADGFGIAPDPARAVMPAPAGVDLSKTYRLPELIDLAQRTNPATSAAWQQARQAALAVGMVEASYLPVISASVVAGRQEVATPLPVPVGNDTSFKTTVEGTAQILALQWLLFDFGERKALREAARQGAVGAGVLFNASHQQLIYQVAQSYYLYGAAIQRRGFADAALANSREIRAAAEARAGQGLATSVEVAQARQAVAQAELRRVQAAGAERDAYQALLAAVGTNAPLKVDAAAGTRRALPPASATPLDAAIRQALSRRPDVAASYAAMQASASGVQAAQAAFRPKVFVGGNLAWGSDELDVGALPGIGQQGSGSGVVVGMTVPLYEGGLRDAQLRQARSRAGAAADEFRRVQTAAVTEVVAARNALGTALESNRAATALVAAATTTYDAAFAAYRNGVGTIDAATAADSGLLDAREAQAEAHAAALVGAVNLAFAVGALSSHKNLP